MTGLITTDLPTAPVALTEGDEMPLATAGPMIAGSTTAISFLLVTRQA